MTFLAMSVSMFLPLFDPILVPHCIYLGVLFIMLNMGFTIYSLPIQPWLQYKDFVVFKVFVDILGFYYQAISYVF